MKKSNKLNFVIILFLFLSVVYPLLCMLFRVYWSTFTKLIDSIQFKTALTNSVFVSIISTFFSVLIAFVLAYTLNRTKIKHRQFLKILLTIPMLIPSISHGIGLINLFGKNGIFTNIFSFNLIGPIGIIIGSILYSFPIAFLMIDNGFKYIDNNMYSVADVIGMNRVEKFKKITLVYLKKPIFSAIFAVFTMVFTDYGLPLTVGGMYTTLPVFLYKEVIGLLDFSKGTMIGLFLLIPAIISFLFDTFTKDNTDISNHTEYIMKKDDLLHIVFKFLTYCVIIFVFIIIFSFVYYAFLDDFILNKTFSLKHFNYIFNNNITKNLFNSLIIAIFTSIIGTIISYTIAYHTARKRNFGHKVMHFITISTLAVPGIVLGLSFIFGFKSTIIYNTFLILILVNIIHFISSPYLIAYNALKKINLNYEIVAATCNIRTISVIKDVIIPCTKTTIREMFSYFFVNSMITISAVAFLYSTKTMPLSLLISQYEGNLMLEECAIISLIILIINLIVKTTVYLLNRKDFRRVNNANI